MITTKPPPQDVSADLAFGVARFSLWHFWKPQYWLAWIGFGLLKTLLLLPSGLRSPIATGLGGLAFFIARRERRVTLINLRLAFPALGETQRRKLARQHFASLIYSIFEAGMVWFGTRESLEKIIEFEGLEHLQAGLARGKGVLLLGAHYTTNEIAATALGLQPVPVDVMYRPTDHPLIQELALRGRTRWGGRLIPNTQFVELLRALKSNRVVLFAPDQRYIGEGHLSVPLFGVNALSNPATTWIHRATQTTVLLYEQERLPNGHYRMRVLAPRDGYPSKDAVADIQTYHAFIESLVQRVPEQYLWSYKRFRPLEGQPDPYRRNALR